MFAKIIVSCAVLTSTSTVLAADSVTVGTSAPLFSGTLQDGKSFSLNDRQGKGWTVLYFYPKAGTPGCTKQACAFRDAIEVIRKEGAEVYGVSADTVEAQRKFHDEHKLNFNLIADPDLKIITAFDAKMPVMKMSKRWTFLIDPNLKIRWVEKDVDPSLDAQKVAEKLKSLQAGQ